MPEETAPPPSYDAHLHIRLPRPLLEAIRRAARQDRRTLSSYARDRLARAAREDGETTDTPSSTN